MEKQYTIEQLRDMLCKAKSVDEIKRIKSLFPHISEAEIEDAHRRLDDGIYNANGTLVGEKHPDD